MRAGKFPAIGAAQVVLLLVLSKEAEIAHQLLLSLNRELKAFHLNKSVELTGSCGNISGSEPKRRL